MTLVFETLNQQQLSINLDDENWGYEVYFTNQSNTNEAMLWVINRNQTLLDADDIILFFNTIKDIPSNNITNVYIEKNDDLVFDANRLLFVYQRTGLEYAEREFVEKYRPGVGLFFVVHFYNTYIPSPIEPAQEEE